MHSTSANKLQAKGIVKKVLITYAIERQDTLEKESEKTESIFPKM